MFCICKNSLYCKLELWNGVYCWSFHWWVYTAFYAVFSQDSRRAVRLKALEMLPIFIVNNSVSCLVRHVWVKFLQTIFIVCFFAFVVLCHIFNRNEIWHCFVYVAWIYTLSQKSIPGTQPLTTILTVVVWFQQFFVQILLSEYAIKRWFNFPPHLFSEWWGACVVICLGWGADMHMTQLMPLPHTASCFSKIRIDFTFLVSAYPGNPWQSPEGRKMHVSVYVCVCSV